MSASTGEFLVEDDESLRKILTAGKRRVAVHSEDEYRLKDRKYIIEKENVTDGRASIGRSTAEVREEMH